MTTAGAPLAIEATGLEKSFGETRAVAGVDLAVPEGAIYGVLGPNGAGKTTVIRMLATLIPPDAGTARVLGHDIRTEGDAVRGLVSLTGQLASVDEELTGRENLILLGRLLGLGRAGSRRRADELLEAFGIAEAAGRLVKHYSGGMRRRLDIAASIVVTPRLMFLDEPTTGLDPRSRGQVWEICRALVGGRDDDPALHAVPGGGRPARRRDRGHRPRPGDRRGHPGPAQGVGRRRGAARAAARTRRAPRRGRASSSAPSAPWSSNRTPRRCRCPARTPAGRRPASPSCPGPASASRSSPSASPASTRCSWP